MDKFCTMFPSQKEIVDGGYLKRNTHLVVNTYQGTGKTFLAEILMEKTVARGFKAVYLSSLKAFADQQYRKFKGDFTDQSVAVPVVRLPKGA